MAAISPLSPTPTPSSAPAATASTPDDLYTQRLSYVKGDIASKDTLSDDTVRNALNTYVSVITNVKGFDHQQANAMVMLQDSIKWEASNQISKGQLDDIVNLAQEYGVSYQAGGTPSYVPGVSSLAAGEAYAFGLNKLPAVNVVQNQDGNIELKLPAGAQGSFSVAPDGSSVSIPVGGTTSTLSFPNYAASLQPDGSVLLSQPPATIAKRSSGWGGIGPILGDLNGLPYNLYRNNGGPDIPLPLPPELQNLPPPVTPAPVSADDDLNMDFRIPSDVPVTARPNPNTGGTTYDFDLSRLTDTQAAELRDQTVIPQLGLIDLWEIDHEGQPLPDQMRVAQRIYEQLNTEITGGGSGHVTVAANANGQFTGMGSYRIIGNTQVVDWLVINAATLAGSPGAPRHAGADTLDSLRQAGYQAGSDGSIRLHATLGAFQFYQSHGFTLIGGNTFYLGRMNNAGGDPYRYRPASLGPRSGDGSDSSDWTDDGDSFADTDGT